MLLPDPVLPEVLLDPSDSSGSRFSSPYPAPAPVELPRDGLEPPVDPLELRDEPDEPWSFLFRSFAIRPPALLGVLITPMNLCGAMPPLRSKKSNIHAILIVH